MYVFTMYSPDIPVDERKNKDINNSFRLV